MHRIIVLDAGRVGAAIARDLALVAVLAHLGERGVRFECREERP